MSLRLHQGKGKQAHAIALLWHCACYLKAFKVIPLGYSLTQVKAQSNCIRAGSFAPLPPDRPPESLSLPLASTHNPYKEVILSRRPFNEGVKGCTRGPQPRYGLAVLPMILLSRTIAYPAERDLNNRFSYNLVERFGYC